jgi:hypothetical protein
MEMDSFAFILVTKYPQAMQTLPWYSTQSQAVEGTGGEGGREEKREGSRERGSFLMEPCNGMSETRGTDPSRSPKNSLLYNGSQMHSSPFPRSLEQMA